MKSILTPALVVLLSITGASPVLAQTVQIGPNGIRVVPDDQRGPPPPPRGEHDGRDFHGDGRDSHGDRRFEEISDRQAVRIARGEGLRQVDEIRRGRMSLRVIGTDRRGDDIVVVIDRHNGEVIDVR